MRNRGRGWGRLPPMASAKYPLDPLLDVRGRGVDTAKAELGESVKARGRAEHERERAEERRREAEARAQQRRDAERAELERGALRAVDLARGDAWEVAASAEAQELEGEVARAADVVARARAQEAEALAALAQRKAEHAVVERDKEKFRARAKKAVEQKEDEAGDEAFASKWVRRDD